MYCWCYKTNKQTNQKPVFSFKFSQPISPTLIDTSSRDSSIDTMCPVCYTTKRNKKCFLKNTELLYTQKKVSYVLSYEYEYTLKICSHSSRRKAYKCFSNSCFIEWAGSCRKNCIFCNYHTHKNKNMLKNANPSRKHSNEVHVRVEYTL